MHSFQRRKFLRHLTATLGGITVAGCGGGNGEAEAAASPSAGTSLTDSTPPSIPGPAPYIQPDPPIAPDPAPASTGAIQFSLSSVSAAASAPFCIGYAFRKGDVPAGKSVVGSIASLQVTPKNYWPDGSLKFAVVAGRAALSAGNSSTVNLSVGTSSAGTNLTTADLKATGIVASTGCGSFGSVTWATTDWDSPFQTWISGPEMSSWIYRKPVGSDRHLVAWLEVRLFKGGAVEVLPWIENGFLMVAGPINKSATYTFTLGGTQRSSQVIDLPSRCRTPLLSGAVVSYWLDAEPDVTVKHDVAYLQATRLVPLYSATVATNAAVVAGLPATYSPLQQGGYTGGMGDTGYQPAIGLLPEWDVLYLTSVSDKGWKAVQFQAYSAGRYPIHYRDEGTNRPIRFSSYPNLSTNSSSTNAYPPRSAGTAAPGWDIPHHPSVGYMAYLITGRSYFLDELQFAATNNFLYQVDSLRGFTAGVFLSSSGASTTRGAGWAIRTLAQAAVITPDGDALRTEFVASLEANVDWNHARYVAQTNNPFGFVQPYSDYTGAGDNVYFEAAWMQDFYTAAFGYALSMEPALSTPSSARLAEFFQWKAQSVIGRLGGTATSDYLYRDAAQYTLAVAPTDAPDFVTGKGPWYSDWGAIYAATLNAVNPGTAGDLRGAYFPDATSYWGNLQPAIAYAVEHKVPGASTAYQRMTSAGNWNQFHAAFDVNPVWSVLPFVGA